MISCVCIGMSEEEIEKKIEQGKKKELIETFEEECGFCIRYFGLKDEESEKQNK